MGISKAEQTLSNHMRLLWEQHVYWTRMAILSMVFGLPDSDFVTNRLLRNPKDFEAALRPFYGENIAAQFAELLTSHLTIAAELVQAAKAGDSTAAADAEKRWYANANQIAAFLDSINPNWSEQEWQKLLNDHLAMTKAEAVDILTQKYVDSINMFENIEQEALTMADIMTQGIVKQFPQYFR
ncbi:MAG: acetylglutamate kinase [Clostridiaceae bacterium]|nr:acetylglutamate kinase [Clostridiaceae bacterium]